MSESEKESSPSKAYVSDEIEGMDVFERIEELESHVRRLNSIITFHGLNKIDRKYLKAFPSKNEYPFFTTKDNEFKVDRLGFGESPVSEFKPPDDPAEYEKAKERMREYNSHKNTEMKLCFELVESVPDTLDEYEVKGETFDVKEADKWYDESPYYISKIEGLEGMKFKTRSIRKKFKRVPKDA